MLAIRSKNRLNRVLRYAKKLSENYFRQEELSNGIFVDKGEENHSKSRTPLDEERTSLIKGICEINVKI